MVNQLRGIDFLLAEDPVIRSKDQISLTKRLDRLGIIPLEGLHLFPVNILDTISSGLYVVKFSGGNGVTNPEYKLSVFIIGELCSIHPESTNGYGAITRAKGVRRVLIAGAHMECTLGNVYHARRFGQCILTTRRDPMHLAVIRQGAAFILFSQYSTTRKHQHANGCEQGVVRVLHFHTLKGYWANIIFWFIRQHNVTIYFFSH